MPACPAGSSPVTVKLRDRVTDTGTGIAADRLGKVFEKGEGDTERAESTGLGLAIVKNFVEGHGGEVSAESVEGQGTTIRFTLPAH